MRLNDKWPAENQAFISPLLQLLQTKKKVCDPTFLSSKRNPKVNEVNFKIFALQTANSTLNCPNICYATHCCLDSLVCGDLGDFA